MAKEAVGFIGLGIMGAPMAGHVLAAGYPLTVFNRTRSKADVLVAQGAQLADSPGQVAANSQVIITIVSDSPDVEEVVAGPGGVLESIRPGSVLVDMSTISPEVERRLEVQLQQRGCRLLDAPVSGGDTGAIAGTLAIMVGGQREAFDRVLPIFTTMGKTVTYCGGVGSGQLTKLCNQVLVSMNLLGVCEAVSLAERNGLDPQVMVEAVGGGAAGSWQLSNLGPKIIEGDYRPGFMVDLILKDLRLVMETGTASAAPVPGTALVRQLFLSAQALGSGREGTQALSKVLQRLAS